MNLSPPTQNFAPFHQSYIDAVGELDPIDVLSRTQLDVYASIPSSKINYRYAPDKWTIAQVLGHIIDTERVFSYRLLRLMRRDPRPLMGFEQDEWIDPGQFEQRPWISLLDEYSSVRQSTLALVETLDESHLDFVGTISDHPVSTHVMLYLLAGHELHHIKILYDRYL